jgi:ABC-type transport system substrate-binding protein
MYQAFVSGELDLVEFLIPQISREELDRYRRLGQLYISSVPFVDSIFFITDRPPFNNPNLRRAFVLATDRERLAREVENMLPGTGGYIPPYLPGHSDEHGLPYDPEDARRLLAAAGYPQGEGFPPVELLLGLVGWRKGTIKFSNP